MGFELVRVDIDHDLPVRTPERLGNAGAGHVGNLVAHADTAPVSRSGVSFSPSPLNGDQTDRQTRCVELEDHRRQGSWWQAAQIGHRKARDLANRGIRIGSGLEIDLDEAHSRQGARFNVLDVARQSKEALDSGR